jgi:hypothetical protein
MWKKIKSYFEASPLTPRAYTVTYVIQVWAVDEYEARVKAEERLSMTTDSRISRGIIFKSAKRNIDS